MESTLDLQTMMVLIDALVCTEFCTHMELKLLPVSKPYTQKESKEMAHILAKIYSIAHCIHCESCAGKYLKVLPKDETHPPKES